MSFWMHMLLLLGAVMQGAAGTGCLLKKDDGIKTSGTRWAASGAASMAPHTLIKAEDLPAAFDWRNHDGKVWLTSVLNQHMPLYCGSCWLHASTSTVSDRIKIENMRKGNMIADVILARQVVLNCGMEDSDPELQAGTCMGGTSDGYMKWVAKHGLPDDTCQEYDATDHECSAFRTCMNCQRNTLPDGTLVQDCYPVQRYAKWFVSEWGKLKNPTVHEAKAEIHARGPLICSMDSSWIENGKYAPGSILMVTNKTWDIDHEVSLVGWGVESAGGHDNIPYWIIRNSWGTFWGDGGFFRARQGLQVAGLEQDCTWVVMMSDPVTKDWGPSEDNRDSTKFPSNVKPVDSFTLNVEPTAPFSRVSEPTGMAGKSGLQSLPVVVGMIVGAALMAAAVGVVSVLRCSIWKKNSMSYGLLEE